MPKKGDNNKNDFVADTILKMYYLYLTILYLANSELKITTTLE